MTQSLMHSRNLFRMLGFTAILVASLPGLIYAQNVDLESIPTITVTGVGESSAVPDTAYITVGVETNGEQAGEVLRENSQAMERLFDTLKLRGVANRDMQTTNFSISPVYESARRGEAQQPPRITGYRIRNQVRVKVSDLDAIGFILDDLVLNGSNRVDGISFDVADPVANQDEARVNAVKDALRKATLLAEAAGAKVGRAVRISESVDQFRPQPTMMRMAAESSVPIARGEQQINARVTVVYELVQP